ncbi:hypothetical protein [Ureibacillus aquaedulcis]|uniref:Uncharacterized protein n=1 Tax=Ureibacillus aquaedulcis TaxID=3058421 RepID=A0ABT8GMT9_9BACL|nr:hypothetical protein [Ureibacillus sp. BA0131]MDN4492251.1 hypothetical protein [Ureibacillus sp. BA0131]
MAHIPTEAVPNLESAIYLPMLLIVLEKDQAQIEAGQFKLKRPYIYLIDEARKLAEHDLRKTKAYLKSHQLRVVQGKRDEMFTEYQFHYRRIMDVRRYSNIRLRNHVEDLLKMYLKKASSINSDQTNQDQKVQ